MSSATSFNLDQSKMLSGNGFTLCHTILTFNDLEKDAFQKHCRKRRNCSILSFSHDVFYPAQQRFQFFNDIFFLSSSNPFRLDKSANLLFGEELTLSQMTKFRLSQTQRV